MQPPLTVEVSRPLLDFLLCSTECEPLCCGIDAFGGPDERFSQWCADHSDTIDMALTQAEALLRSVRAHDGEVMSHEINYVGPREPVLELLASFEQALRTRVSGAR